MVFRGDPSLKDSLAPSIFQNWVGFHKCKRCAVCSNNHIRERKTTSFVSNSTSQNFVIKSFITCSTTHMVYLLICPCGLQYTGLTVRPLQVRLNEHIGNIRRGFKGCSGITWEVHNRDPRGTSFLAIDKLKSHWRGRSKRAISKLEISWIYGVK